MPILAGYPANAEDVNAALALRLATAGGNMTGPIVLSANATTAMQAAAFGQIPLAATTVPPMDSGTGSAGNAATWARGNHVHPTDTSRFAVTGGTITGPIYVQGGVYAGTNVDNGLALINDGSNRYLNFTPDGWKLLWQNSTGDLIYINNSGNWLWWSDGGGSITAANLASNNNVTGNWIYSNGDFGGHNLYVDGGLGINFRGVYNSGVWYAFGWDGHLNIAINGGGQGQLAFVYELPNQNVNYGSNPTFGTVYFNGSAQFNMGGGNMGVANGVSMCISSAPDAAIAFNSAGAWATQMGARQDGHFEIGGWSWQRNCMLLDGGGNVTFLGTVQGNADVHAGGWGIYYMGYGQWYAFQDVGGGWTYAYRNGQTYGSLQPNSAAEFKQDIAPSTLDCLDVLKGLPLHQYRWVDAPDAPLTPVGFIADDLHKAFAPGVRLLDDKPMAIDTNVMLALLVGAVRELSAEVAALKAA